MSRFFCQLTLIYDGTLFFTLHNIFFQGSAFFIAMELLVTCIVIGAVFATAQFSEKFPNAVLVFNFYTPESLSVAVFTASVYIGLCGLMTFGLVRVFHSYRRLRDSNGDKLLLNAHRCVFQVLAANFLFLLFFEVCLPVLLGVVAMLSLSSNLRFICSFGMAFSVSLVPNCACVLILSIVKPYRVALKRLFTAVTCVSTRYTLDVSTWMTSRVS